MVAATVGDPREGLLCAGSLKEFTAIIATIPRWWMEEARVREETAVTHVPGGVRVLAAAVALALVASACSGSSGGRGVAVSDCLTAAQCYGPSQFRAAYGIQPLLDKGIDGRGETVVLPEFVATASLPPVTDIRADLARFDNTFAIPAADLQVDNSLARSRSPWLANNEEVQDTEIVHAVAPQAAIRVVLISDQAQQTAANASTDLTAVLRLGMTEGAVISYSHSWGERCFTSTQVAQLTSALDAANNDQVTVVSAAGDFGASANPCPGTATTFYPTTGTNLISSEPLVLAVGGTSLRANRSTGAYVGETAWNTPRPSPAGINHATNGGFSQLFPRPGYQAGVPGTDADTARAVPDVAADADPITGMALAITQRGPNYQLIGASGTSAAAPLWAAVIALADQYAGRRLGFVNQAIYQIGLSTAGRTAFHDITSGTNSVQTQHRTITGYQASPGWDPLTGWGSPNAQLLIPLLARNVSH